MLWVVAGFPKADAVEAPPKPVEAAPKPPVAAGCAGAPKENVILRRICVSVSNCQ